MKLHVQEASKSNFINIATYMFILIFMIVLVILSTNNKDQAIKKVLKSFRGEESNITLITEQDKEIIELKNQLQLLLTNIIPKDFLIKNKKDQFNHIAFYSFPSSYIFNKSDYINDNFKNILLKLIKLQKNNKFEMIFELSESDKDFKSHKFEQLFTFLKSSEFKININFNNKPRHTFLRLDLVPN